MNHLILQFLASLCRQLIGFLGFRSRIHLVSPENGNAGVGADLSNLSGAIRGPAALALRSQPLFQLRPSHPGVTLHAQRAHPVHQRLPVPDLPLCHHPQPAGPRGTQTQRHAAEHHRPLPEGVAKRTQLSERDAARGSRPRRRSNDVARRQGAVSVLRAGPSAGRREDLHHLRGVLLRRVSQGHPPQQEALHGSPSHRASAGLPSAGDNVRGARGREGQHVLCDGRAADLRLVQASWQTQGPSCGRPRRPIRQAQGRRGGGAWVDVCPRFVRGSRCMLVNILTKASTKAHWWFNSPCLLWILQCGDAALAKRCALKMPPCRNQLSFPATGNGKQRLFIILIRLDYMNDSEAVIWILHSPKCYEILKDIYYLRDSLWDRPK